MPENGISSGSAARRMLSSSGAAARVCLRAVFADALFSATRNSHLTGCSCSITLFIFASRMREGVGHNVLGNIAAADNGQNGLHPSSCNTLNMIPSKRGFAPVVNLVPLGLEMIPFNYTTPGGGIFCSQNF